MNSEATLDCTLGLNNMPVSHQHFLKLKGLAMIFTRQENLLIIFRSKEIHIYFKTNNKFAGNMRKNRDFGKFYS